MPSRLEALLRALTVLCLCLGAAVFASAPSNEKKRLLATTSLVGDLVRRIAATDFEVHSLMGAGIDPHLYKASPSDLIRLQTADLIFYSGLHLEGRMQNVFTALKKKKRRVVAVTDALPRELLLKAEGVEGYYDPHVWFDPELWLLCAKKVAESIKELEPSKSSAIDQRFQQLAVSFENLTKSLRQQSQQLKKEERVLVTSHDAFRYFGRAFDFEVIGVQGLSTTAEVGLADLMRVIQLVKKRKVQAVFFESSVPRSSAERVAQDAQARMGGELYSDALGPEQADQGLLNPSFYEGMMRVNMDRIVKGLKK